MRVLIGLLLWKGISATQTEDMCSWLCEADPNCTGGSYTKRDHCHAYFFLPDTERRGFCYHNSETTTWCLSSFEKVRPEDVPSLLESISVANPDSSRLSARDAPSLRAASLPVQGEIPNWVRDRSWMSFTTSTLAPTTTVDPDAWIQDLGDDDFEELFVWHTTSTSTTTVAARTTTTTTTVAARTTTTTTVAARTTTTTTTVTHSTTNPPPAPSGAIPFLPVPGTYPRSALARTIQEYHRSLDRSFLDQVVEGIVGVGGGTPLSQWQELGGPALLNRAYITLADWGVSQDSKLTVVKGLMILATNLVVVDTARQQFGATIGLGPFCQLHSEIIGNVLTTVHRGWSDVARQPYLGYDRDRSIRRNSISAAFAAYWGDYCPGVLSSSRLRGISLLHRVLREIYDSDSGGSHYVNFNVHRESAFEDSVYLLTRPVSAIRGTVSASFDSEEAVGQGVARDWFTEVASQIYNPDYALFERKAEEPYYTKISSMAAFQDNTDLYFKAVGRFLGLSILNDNPVGVTFPVMVYGRILATDLTLEDIALDEPELFNSFTQMRAMSAADLDSMQLEIEVGGTEFRVTLENREALIKRKINSLLSDEEKRYIDIIGNAMFEVIPAEAVDGYLTPHDLRDIVYGNPDIDIDDFEASATFGYGYSATSPQIQWLFTLLREFDLDMRQKFLRFVTSNPRLPIGGFASLHRPIEIRAASGADGKLPNTHTCFHQLDLPMYSREEILREKVTIAVRADAAMGEL